MRLQMVIFSQNVGGTAKHSLRGHSCKKSDKCKQCEYASCQKVDLRKHMRRDTQWETEWLFSPKCCWCSKPLSAGSHVSQIAIFFHVPLSSPSPSTTLRKIQNSVIVFWWKMNFKMKHRPLLLSENNINSCNQSIKAGMKNKHRVKVLLKIIKSWLDITSVIVQIWEPDEDKASRFTCFGWNQLSIGSWQAHWSFCLSCGMATLLLRGECFDQYLQRPLYQISSLGMFSLGPIILFQLSTSSLSAPSLEVTYPQI